VFGIISCTEQVFYSIYQLPEVSAEFMGLPARLISVKITSSSLLSFRFNHMLFKSV